MTDLTAFQNLNHIQSALLDGDVRMVDLVSAYIRNAKGNSRLNFYVEIFEEDVLENARIIDSKLDGDRDQLGSLFGLVISIKDVICYKGHEASAGSKILQGFVSSYTATALQRLLDEDALVIGRTNCDEFAMGSSNETSCYGPAKNGDDPGRVPGGSSGGAAVSVQMHTCLIALGSDTGGSVRQPASFCGLYGLKPTYGRVSRYGLIAYGSSFDQIGIIGRDVDDLARVLKVMAGVDSMDATSRNVPLVDYLHSELPSNSKFALFEGLLDHPKLSREIAANTKKLTQRIANAGFQVRELPFPFLDYLVPCYYVLTTAEASSNLGRYDGIRYGFRPDRSSDVIDLYKKTRTLGFGREAKRRIMLGTFVLSAGYYDAYFSKAQQVRRLIVSSLNKILCDYDYIIMPVSTDVAWPLGRFASDPVEMYLSDVFTVLANLAGIPAISIPLGKSEEGLSTGIQLMTKKFEEGKLLTAANVIRKLA